MILVRSLFVAAALLVSSVTFANDNQPNHGNQYVCFAHSTHSEARIYRGEVSTDRHEAKHSAIEACEYYENHQCAPHGCRRVSSYGNENRY